ncbi:host specificity factor TipJ family phage tail protein, partial [Cohaesibacter celericrescens]|uniref:host specificity factor TipJ family phage tail protein n=1 Tax=Cohaesibacter celericrescens TaxID=2067669 RepID=UPI00356270BA
WSDRVVADNDVCLFVAVPAGGGGSGGGSNPLRTILTVAVMVAATIVTGGVAGLFEAGSLIGGLAGAAAGAAVTIGGMALVNALVPVANNSASRNTSSISTSPTYSLAAQGNTARFGDVVPVQYGRHILFPDYIAPPWAEYSSNEQYLYQTLCLGVGECEIHRTRIDKTDIANFDEITTELVLPGATATLFDTNVITAEEVSGQEAKGTNETGADWVGPFVATAVETVVTSIHIDIVLARGLYYADDNGDLENRTVTWDVEARLIDDDDQPLGSWISLGSESITDATATAIRRSYSYAVSNGRYEVRLERTNDKDLSSRAGNDLQWVGLRSSINGVSSWPGLTVLLVKARATNNLSSRTSRRINVIQTRKLPIWDDVLKVWSAPVATRSIVWAFCDILRAEYGGQLSDDNLLLPELTALDVKLTARGDYCDGIFDSLSSIWDALASVARCGRAVPVQQGALFRLIRDEPLTLPVAMFSTRNIVQGSFSIDFVVPSEETADAVKVGFFNAKTWKGSTELAVLPGGDQDKPATVQLFGITDRDHAQREGQYIAASNVYRRVFVTFQTELEGLLPTYGSLIAVSHDVPRWGVSGDVVTWDASSKTMTLSEPIEHEDGKSYMIGLRNKRGGVGSVVDVASIVSPTEIILDTLPDFEPYTGAASERTIFAFGEGENWSQLARVIKVVPRNNTALVEITAVLEDSRVHVN